MLRLLEGRGGEGRDGVNKLEGVSNFEALAFFFSPYLAKV